MKKYLMSRNHGVIQICSDNCEAFVRTNTLPTTASACLSLEGASWRRSWSEKARVRSRKRRMSQKTV